MEAAALESDDRRADPLITATLSACPDAAAWVDALLSYPAAMRLTSSADPYPSLDTVCSGHLDTPVCADAQQRGLLSY
jgi:hypothetical protein